MNESVIDRVRDSDLSGRSVQSSLNCFALGQSELPKVLLASNVSEESESAVFQAILRNPDKYWLFSSCGQTPHHLQWLAVNHLLCVKGSELSLELAKQVIEFRLVLHQAYTVKHCHSDILCSLCYYHDAVIQKPRKPSKDGPVLSEAAKKYLHFIVDVDAPLGHVIIESLLSDTTSDSKKVGMSLQSIYVKCIHQSLTELRQMKNKLEAKQVLPAQESDGNDELEQETVPTVQDVTEKANHLMQKVYETLSFINPIYAPEDSQLDILFLHLLKINVDLCECGAVRFDPARLYSCLLHKNSSLLIEKLQEVEEFLRQNKSFTPPGLEEGCVIKDLKPPSEEEKWKSRFFSTLRDSKHFLEDVMDQGLSLISSGELKELPDLLSSEFSPLRPLLLLLGWDRYPHQGSGRELLETLWPDQELLNQSALMLACQCLAYQVHLVEWCLQQLKQSLPTAAKAALQLTKASEMFKGLESHSVLYVLYHATPLVKLDPDEVFKVLEMSPYNLPTIAAGHILEPLSPFLTPLKGTSRSTSPLSLTRRISNPGTPPSLSEQSLKPNQERDVSLFHAFCCIKFVMEAIYGEKQDGSVKGKRLNFGLPGIPSELEEELAVPLGNIESHKKKGSGTKDTLSLLFKEKQKSLELNSSTTVLQKAKHHLIKVFPLSFRLEVMENIFSLLFLQKSDYLGTEDGSSQVSSKGNSSFFSFESNSHFSDAMSFFADEAAIREILSILFETLQPLTEDKDFRFLHRRAASQGRDVLNEDTPEHSDMLVDSSITASQAKHRFMALKKHVSEAQWRLQVLSGFEDKTIPDRTLTGSLEMSPSGGLLDDQSSTSQDEINTGESDEEDETAPTWQEAVSYKDLIRHPSLQKSRKTTIKRSYSLQVRHSSDRSSSAVLSNSPVAFPILDSSVPLTSTPRRNHSEKGGSARTTKAAKQAKRSNDKDNDSGKEGDIEDATFQKTVRKSRKTKALQLRLETSTGAQRKHLRKPVTKTTGIVNRLLASPTSLLRSCILKDNHAQAKEVLFNLAVDEDGVTIVDFMEKYSEVSQKIGQKNVLSLKSSLPQPISHTKSSTEDSSSPAGQTLQSAIINATLVAGPLSDLNILLSLPNLDKILYFGDKELQEYAKMNQYLAGMENFVPGLTILDLTCSQSTSGVLVHKLLNMANQNLRMAPHQPIKLNKHPFKPLISGSVQQKNSVEEEIDDQGPIMFLNKLLSLAQEGVFSLEGSCTPSPHAVLASSLPLDVELIGKLNKFCKYYNSAQEALEMYLNTLVLEDQETDELTRPEVFERNLDSVISALSLHPNCAQKTDTDANTDRASVKSLNVVEPVGLLKRFSVYLNRFAGIVRDAGISSFPLKLLNDGPTQIVGQLVFQQDLPLFQIKGNLSTLGINIIEVIIRCCCKSPLVESPRVEMKNTGCVVLLNDFEPLETFSDENPCTMSYNLLSEVVRIIKSCQSVYGSDQLRELGKSADVRQVLTRTGCFKEVDLAQLSEDEKVCFLANLVNLSYIHALIWYECAEAECGQDLGISKDFTKFYGNFRSSRFSKTTHCSLMSGCGYLVGQLGPISCFDLHYMVLLKGAELPSIFEGVAMSLSVPTVLENPLRPFLHNKVDPKLKLLLSDGWNKTSIPKPLHPTVLDEALENTEEKVVSISQQLGYYSNNARQRRDTDGGDAEPKKFMLTSDVLSFIMQENQFLGSFTKLLAEEQPREHPQAAEEKTSRTPSFTGKSLPITKQSSKAKRSVMMETVGGRPMVQPTFLGPASLKPLLDRKQKSSDSSPQATACLPSHWYGVDLQDHFSDYQVMLNFLEVRLKPFLTFCRATEDDLMSQPDERSLRKSQIRRSLASAFRPKVSSQQATEEEFEVDRQVAILPASHPSLMKTCVRVFLHVLKTRGQLRALELIKTEPFDTVSNHPALVFLTTYSAKAAFVDLAEKLKSDPKLSDVDSTMQPDSENTAFTLLTLIAAPSEAAGLLLPTLSSWSVKGNLQMLSYCLTRLSKGSRFTPILRKWLERMTIYGEILEKKREREKDDADSASNAGEEQVRDWKSWTDLKEATLASPTPVEVLKGILKYSDFSLARRWGKVHNLDKSIFITIEQCYLSELLEKRKANKLTIYKTLEKFEDKEDQKKICEGVLCSLAKNHAKSSMLPEEIGEPILHYLIKELQDVIPLPVYQSNKSKVAGVMSLLSLPEEERRDYVRLVSKPYILLEQLLMESKLDSVGQVVTVLRKEEFCDITIEAKDLPSLEKLTHPSVFKDTIDIILIYYARKAVEFPETPDFSPDTPLSPPSRSSTPIPGTPLHMGGNPRRSGHHRSTSIHSQLESTVESPPSFTLEEKWIPPHRVPSQKDWIADRDTKTCMACKKTVFGIYNRRHHCRRCGEVVCYRCSNKTLVVEGYPTAQRVCGRCYQFETERSDQNREATDFEVKAMNMPNFSFHQQWRMLPNDPVRNEELRVDFYYEQSPSVELFLSILEYHSSPEKCAEFIIDQVERISLLAISDSNGHVHEEIDHNFVTGMMEKLLLNAKLKYAEVGDSSGVEQCDSYLSRIDVLRILVLAKCRFTPALQDLTKPDLARRVRDRLIQDDRFGLAIETSTKCSIEIASVWSAWGMACLKNGHFKDAREKFQTCFKMSTTKVSFLPTVKVVNGIIKLLESTHLISKAEDEKHWGTMSQSATAMFTQLHDSNVPLLDKASLEECLFYLRNYGTSLQLVQFYERHNFLKDACHFLLEKPINSEVFIEGLLIPCLKKEKIEILECLLMEIDPTLKVWENHLTAACVYFNSRSLLHILYHLQCFMKDDIRAAQTCIKFYTGRKGRHTQVVDLVMRKHYLGDALKHLESAINLKQNSREGSTVAMKRVMSMNEIKKWQATIKLQMEVISFLDYRVSSLKMPVSLSTSQGPLMSPNEAYPLTLFGSGQARAALACTVVLADSELRDGFNLATRIIQLFQLPMEDILCHMARSLTLNERYQDIKNLLDLIQHKDSLFDQEKQDKVVMAAVKMGSQHSKDIKHIDRLIGLLSDDKCKVQAYIQCGKLKPAYLLAARNKMEDEIRNISVIATQASQVSIRDICEKWLQANTGSNPRKEGSHKTKSGRASSRKQ